MVDIAWWESVVLQHNGCQVLDRSPQQMVQKVVVLRDDIVSAEKEVCKRIHSLLLFSFWYYRAEVHFGEVRLLIKCYQCIVFFNLDRT